MHGPGFLRAALAALCGVVGAAGCVRSGVTRYYTLSALAPAGQTAPAAPALGVGPLRLPQYLRQDAMVVRAEPHRLEYRDADLWAEPPENAVADVLRENLARLTGASVVLRYPWRLEATPPRQVAVDVTAFELTGSSEALLAARWELRDAAGALLRAGSVTYREPAARGIDSLAEALSRALLRLSQDIAAAIPPDTRSPAPVE